MNIYSPKLQRAFSRLFHGFSYLYHSTGRRNRVNVRIKTTYFNGFVNRDKLGDIQKMVIDKNQRY